MKKTDRLERLDRTYRYCEQRDLKPENYILSFRYQVKSTIEYTICLFYEFLLVHFVKQNLVVRSFVITLTGVGWTEDSVLNIRNNDSVFGPGKLRYWKELRGGMVEIGIPLYLTQSRDLRSVQTLVSVIPLFFYTRDVDRGSLVLSQLGYETQILF